MFAGYQLQAPTKQARPYAGQQEFTVRYEGEEELSSYRPHSDASHLSWGQVSAAREITASNTD